MLCYHQVFSEIKYYIDKIDDKEFVYDSDYDDSLPLGKLIYFPTLTVVIRCVFKRDGIYYPQVYLDDCLY